MAKISLLSLNCFEVPFFSPHPKRRLYEIGKSILKLNPDIIFLQEVHLPNYKKILQTMLKEAYPYRFVPLHGFLHMGGGLMFFSKMPIREAEFCRFSKNGNWLDISITDRLAAKGFMKLKLGGQNSFYCFHTHLVADYESHLLEQSKYISILSPQLNQLAASINGLVQKEPVFIVGDLNVTPDSPLFTNFLQKIKARDLTDTLSPSRVRNLYIPPINQFSFTKSFEKLDYILYRGPDSITSDWRYIFMDKPLSDHLGIWANIRLKQ